MTEKTTLSFGYVLDDPNAEKETDDEKIVIRSVHPEFKVNGEQKKILEPVTPVDQPVFIEGDSFPTYAIPRKDENGEFYAVILTEEEISKIFKQEFKRKVFSEHFERYVEEAFPEKDPDELKKLVDYSGMSEAFYRALVFNDDGCNDWYAEQMNEWLEYHYGDYSEFSGDDEDNEEE